MFSRRGRTSVVGVSAGVPAGWYKDVASGERVEVLGDGRLELELAAWGARVLVREDSGHHGSESGAK